jgi:hypothetical protein
MSEKVLNRGDIVKSKKKDEPELRVCFPNEWKDEKDEYKLVEIETEGLKEFKYKSKDEISFILQILTKTSNIKRESIQQLLKSNFIFDYELFTFNVKLSDESLCVIQPLSDEKDEVYKIIITNKVRDIVTHNTVNSVKECMEEIELYLIRNKPSLSFDYFKENMDKYKKQTMSEVVSETEKVLIDISEDNLPKDEFFSDKDNVENESEKSNIKEESN